MFDTFMDKERRKQNLVIHNLPEETEGSPKDKAEKDEQKFKEMIRESMKMNVHPSKSFRVGKKIEGKDRLLIITVESVDVKQDILRSATELRNTEEWRNVFITPDMTRQEREEGKRLRDELKRRRDAGQTGLVIRRGKIIKKADHPWNQDHNNHNVVPDAPGQTMGINTSEEQDQVPGERNNAQGPRPQNVPASGDAQQQGIDSNQSHAVVARQQRQNALANGIFAPDDDEVPSRELPPGRTEQDGDTGQDQN